MKTIPVTEAEVNTIIMSLKPKHSTGYNGISNKILKHCVHSISKGSALSGNSMTTCRNLSVEMGLMGCPETSREIPDKIGFQVLCSFCQCFKFVPNTIVIIIKLILDSIIQRSTLRHILFCSTSHVKFHRF
jgi:hypothetical protein